MKRGIRLLAFLLVFVCLYSAMNAVLKIKPTDGIGTMAKFQELPEDTVDVLFVGSSHVGMNLDCAQLYEETGIAGFNLWSGMQPVWNSYYYVKEGLKKQDPDVVVVEIFVCAHDFEYTDTQSAIKGVLSMPYGIDKIKMAFESFPTWQQAVEAIWALPLYHTRFDELTKSDFTYQTEYANKTGLYEIDNENILDYVMPIRLNGFVDSDETLPLSAKADEYLRKLIHLCKAEEKELVFLIAPYEATEDEMKRLNQAIKIASENNIPVLNYLQKYQEAGLDGSHHFVDTGHLNAEGRRRFTASVGNELKRMFSLSDRRTDADHLWYSREKNFENDNKVFSLKQAFYGDGYSRYIDTGVKLYENRYSEWTILSRINLNADIKSSAVYFSCFSEENDNTYRGLLVKKERENQIAVVVGNTCDIMSVPLFDCEWLDLAIVKKQESYSVYVNGQCYVTERTEPCDPYDGNLLIGCQELSSGGEKFRFSRTQTTNLEVYDVALAEKEILSWTPETLPAMPAPMGMDGKIEKVYAMPEQFMGNSGVYAQDEYIDTGVQLYNEAATRFTLLSRITPGAVDGDKVFFSAFSEVPGEYRGLLLRQTAENQLNLVVGNNYGVNIDCAAGEPVDLAIVKDLDVYSVYANGVKVHEITSACTPYDGTLLIGAQRDAQGDIFRKSNTHVQSLTIMSGALDEAAVRAWDFTAVNEPAVRVASSVEYTLDKAFLGNGKDRYLDTGVQLYDMSDKDWTMALTIRPDYGSDDGVFLSCFSEEVGQYRGFMIRQEAEDSLTMFVGNALTHRIALSETEKIMRLVIVKQGNEYTVYRNGELEAELISECSGYDGTLLIGCQATAEGEPFRFSTAKVDALQLWDGAVSDEEADALSVVKTKDSRFE